MRNSKLRNGTNMVVVPIKHFVTLEAFATALAGYFYDQSEDFPAKLTKKDAEKVLRNSLFFYGLQGPYSDGHFEASGDTADDYISAYEAAQEWILLKYPWLTNS